MESTVVIHAKREDDSAWSPRFSSMPGRISSDDCHFEPSLVLEQQYGRALAAAREFASRQSDSDKTVRTRRSTESGRCQRGDCKRAKLFGHRERWYPEA